MVVDAGEVRCAGVVGGQTDGRSAPRAGEASGGVPEGPAEAFGGGFGEGPVAQACWNHTTRVRAQHTNRRRVEQACEAAGFEGGDVVLDDGVGANVRVARRRGLLEPEPQSAQSAGEQRALRAGVAGFAAHDQNGCGRASRRCRRSVRSATAALGRTSPLWRIARCQHLSVTGTAAMALSMASLRRATRENPTLRSRQASAMRTEQPAESVRNTTGRVTTASSPARCPAATASGSRPIAASRSAIWSTMLLAAALPGRNTAPSASPSSLKHNSG